MKTKWEKTELDSLMTLYPQTYYTERDFEIYREICALNYGKRAKGVIH